MALSEQVRGEDDVDEWGMVVSKNSSAVEDEPTKEELLEGMLGAQLDKGLGIVVVLQLVSVGLDFSLGVCSRVRAASRRCGPLNAAITLLMISPPSNPSRTQGISLQCSRRTSKA